MFVAASFFASATVYIIRKSCIQPWMLKRPPATSVCEQTGCAKLMLQWIDQRERIWANHLSHFILSCFTVSWVSFFPLKFVSLFFLASRLKSWFCILSGNPKKKHTWKFFIQLGGTKYYVRFSFFRIFWICGENCSVFLDRGSVSFSKNEPIRLEKCYCWDWDICEIVTTALIFIFCHLFSLC